MTERPHILIVGGGYAGCTRPGASAPAPAWRGERDGGRPHADHGYQPFLAEAAAGSIEPRHVVVPLRQVLGCEVLTASASSFDLDKRQVTAVTAAGETVHLAYDSLVVAPGSVPRTARLPGLAEHALGFTTFGEAIHLRNHVLSRLDVASAASEPARRRAALTFTVVGGGYSGVELIAELEDLVSHALRYHPGIAPDELRWVLVQASDRILPEVSLRMARCTQDKLVERGIDVRLDTRLESAEDGRIRLSDGHSYASQTLIWTAGVRANPLVAALGLPVNGRGQLVTTSELKVPHVPGLWAAGDAAAVPDLTDDEPHALCGPSAQHAVRQAKRLADNLVAELRGGAPRPYQHRYAGSVASLGRHKAVAEVYGIRLRGWPAWKLHRLYHLSRTPTLNRKARVLADWMLASLVSRDIASLEQVEHPRDIWELASISAETDQLVAPFAPDVTAAERI